MITASVMKELNEMSIRHVNSLRYNWKKIEQYIFFNPFMFVENTRSRLHHELRARNNHYGTIVQKIGISCTSFPCCIKDITDTWNQMKLNVRKSWAWLLIFLYWWHSLLQHESAYFCFSNTYVRVRPLWLIATSFWTDTINICEL